jgi:hypothetical protein
MPRALKTKWDGMEAKMRKIRFGTNFTIFLLFFGLATLEAIQTASWVRVAFWLAIAGAFLYMDSSYESPRDS